MKERSSNRRKTVFLLAAVAVIAVTVLVAAFAAGSQPPEPATGLPWAQTVQPEDIASIRFTVGKRALSYTDYEPEEFAQIAALLNHCDGTAPTGTVSATVELFKRYLYVTMEDGTVHTLVFYDDLVTIDDLYYENCDDWLAAWPEEGRVQVDIALWALEALEETRTQEDLYLHRFSRTDEKFPTVTWMRDGDNWYQHTDDNGHCTSLLCYNGQKFRTEYTYVGPELICSGTGWQASDFEEPSLPWPLDAQLDPQDWSHVESTEFKGQFIVKLRYEPDGTLLHLYFSGDTWLMDFTTVFPDGTAIESDFVSASSSNNDMWLESYYEAAIQGELPYSNEYDPENKAQAQRCREALEQFQTSDSYSLIQSSILTEPFNQKTDSTLVLWNNGSDWLRQLSTGGMEYHFLQKDGRQFARTTETADPVFTGWTETDLSADPMCCDSWLVDFQWDDGKIYCWTYTQEEDSTRITLFVLDDTAQGGYYWLTITLDENGVLEKARLDKTWLDDESQQSIYVSTVHVYAQEGAAIGRYIDEIFQEVPES